MSLKKQFLKSRPVCKVTFSLPKAAAEGAVEVILLGDFNNWKRENGIPLKKKKNGDFSATVELETENEYQFRYLIDDEYWENDWDADKYVPSPYGSENSVIIASDEQENMEEEYANVEEEEEFFM